MASLFQQNSGAMHNPLLPGGDQATASPFGFGPGGQQRASIPREPSTRTQNPIVTGTGVLGLKFKDGVMLAAGHGDGSCLYLCLLPFILAAPFFLT